MHVDLAHQILRPLASFNLEPATKVGALKEVLADISFGKDSSVKPEDITLTHEGRELDDDSILGQQLIEDDSTVTVYIKDAAKQLELLKNANRLANTHVDYRLEIKVLKNTVDDLHKKYLGVLKQLEAASKELVHLHSLRRQARVGNTMETTGSACVTEPPQSQFTDKQGLKDTTGPHYTVVPARFTDKRGLNDNTAPSGIVMSPELSDKRGQQGTAGLDPAVASAQLTELTNKRGRKAVRKQQLKSEETNLGVLD
ncbi:Protein of unknown function [Pyronema omphalodes CBS 100304]|uniref:Ubiquitin-like domain-containing protein n=1 Tax=Pyronema omphalodes (strain CBS 100304) TaxID=1076935 RepID=U4LF73_PYROM|nr:Protein of unknown function [Pyronema omphalodes CBS 100304]